MTSPLRIRRAQADDGPFIADLLRQCRLPVDDLDPAMLPDFLVAEDAGRIIGVVGCEPRGDAVLFRSLAVTPEFRNRGIAGTLTADLARRCKAGGARTAYLLPRTAEAFAAKRGFRVLPRADAPAAIRRTAEFRHAGCAAALCMCKEL